MLSNNNGLYKTVTIKSWKELKHYSEYRSRNASDKNKWSRWIFKGHKSKKWNLSTTLERTLHDRFKVRLSDAWK